MIGRLLLLSATFGSLCQAWTSTDFSYSTTVLCSTGYSSRSTQPTPLPRTTIVTEVQYSSLRPTVTIDAVKRIQAPAVTVTDRTSTEYVNDVVTVYDDYTTWIQAWSTFATATIPKTVCTNGVVPSTVTSYTGTYSPVPGQETTLPATYPTQVVCTESRKTFWGLVPIATTTVTVTETPTVHVFSPTTTVTSTIIWGTDVIYSKTFTSSTTSWSVGYSVATTKTACAATVTATMAAKCAPTNLIGAIHGVGILASGQYANNTHVTYGPRPAEPYQSDASLCCQVCAENPGCAAIMGGGEGDCGLLFVGGPEEPQCGLQVTTFVTQGPIIPYDGVIVQSGCDSVGYGGEVPIYN